MFEHSSHPLIPLRSFFYRMLISTFLGIIFIIIALAVGMSGYHHFEKMSWIDAFLNASMILSGMGPADILHTKGGKLFAGFYALFSGLTFIVIIGVIFAPIFHRFYHKFHLDIDQQKSTKNQTTKKS